MQVTEATNEIRYLIKKKGSGMGHYVYKYVNNGEIIYIGKNDGDLRSRIESHGRSGDNIAKEAWKEIKDSEIYYIELANSIMSDVVESELIRRYKPKYNKAKMSEWSGLPFKEPEWKVYCKPEKNKKKIKINKNEKTFLEMRMEEYLDNKKSGDILLYVMNEVINGRYIFEESHFDILVNAPENYENTAEDALLLLRNTSFYYNDDKKFGYMTFDNGVTTSKGQKRPLIGLNKDVNQFRECISLYCSFSHLYYKTYAFEIPKNISEIQKMFPEFSKKYRSIIEKCEKEAAEAS